MSNLSISALISLCIGCCMIELPPIDRTAIYLIVSSILIQLANSKP